LIKYAKSKKSYSQIGDDLGVSKVRIFQIIDQERKRFSKERVEYWKNQGLSLREIARLFKKAHERVR
jgi:DNA-binding CsgD family transcriptional regulator